METWKKIGIIVLSVIMLFACVFDVWYIVLLLKNENTEIDFTNIWDEQQLSDGTTAPLMQVKYFKNTENNGVEMLDVQFSSVLTEDSEDLYTFGIQITGKSEFKFKWTYSSYSPNLWDTYYVYSLTKANSDMTITYYAGLNGDFSVITESRFNEMQLKVNTGEDIYKISFVQGDQKKNYSNLEQFHYFSFLWGETASYYQYTPLYIVSQIYTAIKGGASGTQHSKLLTFKDVFQVQQLINGKYEDVENTNSTLVTTVVNNYFVADIEITNSGATKAKQSLFGWINGSQSFNIAGDYSALEYIYGKSVIQVTFADCELVQTSDVNVYQLKLKDSFVSQYSQFKNTSVLDVVIDKDSNNLNDITITGFSDDGLAGFTIWQIEGVD
jgi:hypothetical protein